MAQHAIRLRAAWEARDLDQPGRPTFRLDLPVDWSGFDPASGKLPIRLRLTRRFGRPIALDPAGSEARARLIISCSSGVRAVELNGKPLDLKPSIAGRLAIDLPPLEPRNVVSIDLELDASNAAWGDVALVFGEGSEGH